MTDGPDEFGLIARLFAPLAAGFPGALNLTDDAALLEGPAGQQWVVTTDALVAGVHFLPDDPPDLIARKLIRVNLSDLAGKGARPVAVLLAACFPRGVTGRWLDCFALGMKSDCDEFTLALIGGDTVATPGPLTLSLTALGLTGTGSAILRSNARSGDHIWVSGTLGDAAFGLRVARGEAAGFNPVAASYLLDRYRLPRPRLGLGQALVGLAHAGMDISDGLAGDLTHLCDCSGLAAAVVAPSIPLSAAARAALDGGLGQGWRDVLTGGDDYELLFTAAPEQEPALIRLGRTLSLPLTRIGAMEPGRGVTILDSNGQPMSLGAGGYRHFGG
jgi:thiamine-monophosphate kinase